jgi:serine/threonine-protein kinase
LSIWNRAGHLTVVSGSRRGALGGDLDTIVLKSLKKDPRERYPSVAALGSDLRRISDSSRSPPGPGQPSPTVPQVRPPQPHGRRVVAVAAIAVIAGMVGTLMQTRAARRQRDFAYRQLARAERIKQLE